MPFLPPLSTLAPPLTVENILSAVQGVAWRELGRRLLCGFYSGMRPRRNYPKLDEIAQQHQSDDSRLCAVIECWLQGEGVDKEPSWRRIIWALDDATKTTNSIYWRWAAETRAAADNIRHFAEPLPGESCDSITFLYSV